MRGKNGKKKFMHQPVVHALSIVASHFYTTQNLTIENQSIKNFESCYERDLSRGLEGHSCTFYSILSI